MKTDQKAIRKVTGELLASLKLQDKDLSILFVDDRRITALNREYFGKDRPTNVISFSYSDGMPGEAMGDIIISVERTAVEAGEAGIPFYERLFALIVHGLVHIMGYDHLRGESEARKMRYRERRFMDLVRSQPAYRALVDI